MKSPRSLRVLNILDIIGQANTPIRISDIEETTGLPKATVHRICSILLDSGYIRREISTNGMVIGPKLKILASNINSNEAQNSFRHAVLVSLAETIGETCNIAVPDGSRMIYLDRVETQWPLRAQMPIGTKIPLYCTASGKMFLSTLSKGRRMRLLKQLSLIQITPKTKTTVPAICEELDKIAKHQVSTDDEEFVYGMIAVAVPIIDPLGKFHSTLSFHAPVVRMNMQTALTYVPELNMAAKKISDELFVLNSAAA